MHFVKMQGLGNDYVYIDEFLYPGPRDAGGLARRVSDRHFGIGADGLICIQKSENADCRMRMYNADGSEGRMCGNAIRCIAYYMLLRHPERCAGDVVRIETRAGLRAVTALRGADGRIGALRAEMDAPVFDAERIPVRAAAPQDVEVPFGEGTARAVCLSMGNPHAVVFVEEDVAGLDLARLGPPIERSPLFPERVNAEFARLRADGSLEMRVWERGSGETLACGTGACAAAVAAMYSGRASARELVVHLRGGDLRIEWDARDGRVYMTGPAAIAFEGEWLDE